MTDKFVKYRTPKNWKSMINGNEYQFIRYNIHEKEHKGLLPLPKNEYPFTLTYDDKRQKWLDFINQ